MIELPSPWEHVNYIKRDDSGGLWELLEKTFGPQISDADLTEDDFIPKSESFKEPRTRRAMLATTFRWAHIRNTETGGDAYIRIQKLDSINLEINSLILPSNSQGDPITNSVLRTMPIAEIAVAYSREDQTTKANLQLGFHLIDEQDFLQNPFQALPPADNSDTFLAMVAHQYNELQRADPQSNPTKKMASLNNRSVQSVQRWLTTARKKLFLPPTRPGRK